MNKQFYKLFKAICLGMVAQLLFVGLAMAIPAEPKAVVVRARIDVSGKVISATDGLGIRGVSVLVKGTYTGTVPDVEGNYKIRLEDDAGILVFSSIGFVSQEVEVNGRSIINITLEEDVQSLQEVVVVGYGEQKKENLTGSVSTVNTEELRVAPMPSITQSLAGRASGLFIKNG